MVVQYNYDHWVHFSLCSCSNLRYVTKNVPYSIVIAKPSHLAETFILFWFGIYNPQWLLPSLSVGLVGGHTSVAKYKALDHPQAANFVVHALLKLAVVTYLRTPESELLYSQ